MLEPLMDVLAAPIPFWTKRLPLIPDSWRISWSAPEPFRRVTPWSVLC